MPAELLAKWAASAEVIWAADGGANRLAEIGVKPHKTLGDLDGIDPAVRAGLKNVIALPDQEQTDCEKLLRQAQEEGYNSITLACVEGDRLDHVLATVSSCIMVGIQTRLALRGGIGYILGAGEHRTIRCQIGCRMSLIPLGVCIATMSGVEWPLKKELLTLGTRVSISNKSTEDHVRILLRSGAALLVEELTHEEMPVW